VALGRPRRLLALISIGLTLNLTALDTCLLAGGAADAPAEAPDRSTPVEPPANQPSSGPPSAGQTPPDSTAAALPMGITPPHDFRQREGSDQIMITGGAPGAGSGSQTDAEAGAPEGSSKAPFYRRWWFWTAVGGAIATAVLIGASGGDEAPPNLPDFPNPPER
jgi:hypothetical protein